MVRRREEVLNVVLAECICDRGLAADPENIIGKGRKRALPDVLISLRGLRCGIEGKKEGPSAKREVEKQARNRVTAGICHMCIGVIYPNTLKGTSFRQLGEAISNSTLEFMVVTEAESGAWRQGSLDLIIEDLRRAYDVLISDDVVTRSVEKLETGMQHIVEVFMRNQAASKRLADLLEVHDPANDDAD